jgi:rhamnogalacturonan endolyase
VILSTETRTDVFPIAEPTYFVRTDRDGRFRLPGIPPAWRPGSTEAGSYTLYIQPADGSVTDLYTRTGVVVGGRHQNLGDLVWTPSTHGTFLWQLGRSDRMSGEYALASRSPARPMPREYEKPAMIPGTLTFTIGQSWEPTDWYYAQTNPGTWTIRFLLDRAYSGTAYLTVATSMQQSGAPTVAVNGNTSAVTGTLPNNNDSTIARQADRSGYPRTAILTFPASLLVPGDNQITLTHGRATAAGTGLGWDTVVLEVNEGSAPSPARLSATVKKIGTRSGNRTWSVTVRNTGRGAAHDVRFTSITDHKARQVDVIGRDPNRFPVPITGVLAPGAAAVARVTVSGGQPVSISVSADGGRTTATAHSSR